MRKEFFVNKGGIVVEVFLKNNSMIQILTPKTTINVYGDDILYVWDATGVTKNPVYLSRMRQMCVSLLEEFCNMYDDSQLEEYMKIRLTTILNSVVSIEEDPDFTSEMLDDISFHVSPIKSARK